MQLLFIVSCNIYRAAPEVIKGGMFSSRSDVYCFGHLMWEVLTAFDHLQENVEQFLMHNIESKYTTRDEVCDCLSVEICFSNCFEIILTLCVLD